MKRVAIGVIAAALIGAAVARAELSATAEVRYLSAVPSTSAGIDLHIAWTDPSAPGGRPAPIKTLVLRFHPGTRIATAAMVRCRASNADVARRGRAACPAASRIGAGHSILATAAAPSIPARVTLYNAAGQIIVLVETGGRTLAVYRDDVRHGTVTVHFALPGGDLAARPPAQGLRQLAHPRRPAASVLPHARGVSVGRALENRRQLHPHRRLDGRSRGDDPVPPGFLIRWLDKSSE